MDPLASRTTPIDDGYATCERTCAKLLLYPGEMHPDEVTRTIGTQPTETVAKGDTSTNSIGRTRVAKHNCWFLSSEQFVESKDVRRHLDWLLDRLEPASDGLRRLQGTEGVRMTVTCIWWSRSGDGGPTLWPEQMSRLANLNLECGFDVAFYGFVDAEPEVQSTQRRSSNRIFQSLEATTAIAAFGLAITYLRFAPTAALGKLKPMQDFWGKRLGYLVHLFAYSLLPFISGATLVYLDLGGYSLF